MFLELLLVMTLDQQVHHLGQGIVVRNPVQLVLMMMKLYILHHNLFQKQIIPVAMSFGEHLHILLIIDPESALLLIGLHTDHHIRPARLATVVLVMLHRLHHLSLHLQARVMTALAEVIM